MERDKKDTKRTIPCPCGTGCGQDIDGNSLRSPEVNAEIAKVVQANFARMLPEVAQVESATFDSGESDSYADLTADIS